jgi:hypothetical protein
MLVEVITERPRHTPFVRTRVDGGAGGRAARRHLRAAPAKDASRTLDDVGGTGRQCHGDVGTDQDLTGFGRRLHRRRHRRGRARNDQLAVRTADREHVDRPVVHPDRHLQRHPTDRCLDLRGLARGGISTAALQPCRMRCSPVKMSSSASPPNSAGCRHGVRQFEHRPEERG